MCLVPIGLLMPDRSDGQLILPHAEGRFRLRGLDAGAQELLVAPVVHIGGHCVGGFAELDPGVKSLVDGDVEMEPGRRAGVDEM